MREGTVAVIGAGTMGGGIAQAAACAGYRTLLYDSDPARAGDCLRQIRRRVERLVEKGELGREPAAAALERLAVADALEGLADASFVIEAIVEDCGAKRSLFARLGELCRQDAVLASNTSSIPITEIAAATRHPENVIGLHFMNPVPLMPGVEIVRGLKTADTVCQRALRFAGDLAKKPIHSSDRAGFVVNRMLMPLINEAIAIAEEATASVADVDAGAVNCLSHPLGPLALADLIGNDTVLHILSVLESELGGRFKPRPLLRRMVEAGFNGNKCGLGFYVWKDNKRQEVNAALRPFLRKENAP